MKVIQIFVIASIVLNITGCVKSHNIKIIETIPKMSTPYWVNDTRKWWEDNDNFYYKGMIETKEITEKNGSTRMATANESERIATAFVREAMAEEIKNTITSAFMSVIQANFNYADTQIKDVFISKVDGMVITGSTIVESYLQKIQESTENEKEKIYYRCYLLMQISKKDYEKTVKMTFEDTTSQLSDNSKISLTQKIQKEFWKLYNTKNNK